MESDNDEVNPIENMEIEYANNIVDEYEDYEDALFQQLPMQTNQNASSITSNNLFKNFNYCDQIRILRSSIFQSEIDKHTPTIKTLIQQRQNESGAPSLPDDANDNNSQNNESVINQHKFIYDLSAIGSIRRTFDMVTDCDWLDFRLKICELSNDSNISMDMYLIHLRSTLINTMMDIMIFYHTNSNYALKLFKLEGLNLLIILKHNAASLIIHLLPDGFSRSLIEIVKNLERSEIEGKENGFSIPTFTESLMHNYVAIEQTKYSMKYMKSLHPRVIYYSFYAPMHLVVDRCSINKNLEKKISSLQRKYNCKINLTGPFLRNLSPATKNNYYHFEIFFDYIVNYWSLVMHEFVVWMNGCPRNIVECHIDQICVGYVKENFFCCDEITNLMNRHHLLREVDPSFVELIKWVRVNKVDRCFF